MKTDEEVKTERDDVEMLKRDHLWPQLVLPLKRYTPEDGLETAVLDNPCPPAERWMLRVGATIFHPIQAGCPVFFDSAEAIIADGWRVD